MTFTDYQTEPQIYRPNPDEVATISAAGQLILALAISIIIIGAHPLTMSIPAQGATGRITSCKSEYDLCRRVRANPVRTKPNPAMIGSCEARYAKAQQTGVWKSRFGGVRECFR
jgi:hypothetical protein